MIFLTVAAQEFDSHQLTSTNVRIHQINSTFIHPVSLLVSARVLKMQAYYSMMGAAEGQVLCPGAKLQWSQKGQFHVPS